MDVNILNKDYDESTRSLIKGMVEAEEKAIASQKNKELCNKHVSAKRACSLTGNRNP